MISRFEYDEIIKGIESFWGQPCSCHLLQVTGIGGAHTRISRVFRILDNGSIIQVAGGVFGSETGVINRVSDGKNLYFDVRDVNRGKASFELYKFDGARVTRIK